MTYNRSLFVPQGTYFFTVSLADSTSNLLVERVDLLRHAVALCQKQRPFEIDAAVILPAQMHMIWTLPAADKDFSARWRSIKSTFSRHVLPTSNRSQNLVKRAEKGIWQRRFKEHFIRDQDDYALHAHLIATAPLRAGLTRDGSDWPLCSAYKRRMRLGASIRTTGQVPSGPNQAVAESATRMVRSYASETS
jgi:putative transposase